MSQQEIMVFFDKNPGKLYSCNELHKVFPNIHKGNIYVATKKIVKLNGYCAEIKHIKTNIHKKIGKQVIVYGRKK